MRIRKLLNIKLRGFSLLEVMISLFVFSIGMLGLAGLQITAMKNSTSAHFRTTAMILANDIADKVRANNVQVVANPTTAYVYTGGTVPPAQPACETTAGCNPADMESNDMFTWINSVANSLPNGAAQICRDNDPEIPGPGQVAPNIACTGNATDPMVVYIDWCDGNKENNCAGGTLDIKRFVMTF